MGNSVKYWYSRLRLWWRHYARWIEDAECEICLERRALRRKTLGKD